MLSEVSTPYQDLTLTDVEQLMMEDSENNATKDTEVLKSSSGAKFPPVTMLEIGTESYNLTRCRSLDTLTERDLYAIHDSQNVTRHAEGHNVDITSNRLQRISSTGTTVITLSDDIVEVGRSQTGQSVNIRDKGDWKGKRRARSFL